MDVTGPKLSLNNFRPRKPSSKPVHEFDFNSKLKIKSYLKLKKKKVKVNSQLQGTVFLVTYTQQIPNHYDLCIVQKKSLNLGKLLLGTYL